MIRKDLTIETKKKNEIVDITDIINGEIQKEKVSEGLCYAFLRHTTAAITTADLDPGTDQDMLKAFYEMIPAHQSESRNEKGKTITYKHLHDPSHVPDHILSTVIGTSLVVPIKTKQLDLGTWQRVILAEFKGPRKREIVLHFVAG